MCVWFSLSACHLQPPPPRDIDGDGRLNKEELKQWIMPDNYDHAKAEATHLIYESDVDSVS